MLPNLGTRFFTILAVIAIPCIWMLFGGQFNLGLDIKGGTSLIYHVPGDPDDEALDEVKGVMSQRVDKLGLKEITITADKGSDDIIIELPGMSAEEAKHVKRTLLELGNLVWAIEATENELKDPVSGLGPSFNLEAFLQQESQAAQKIAANLVDEKAKNKYAGQVVHLFKNPADYRKPVNLGDKPLFIYYPPNRVYSTTKKQWTGPGVGAIVLNKPEWTFGGDQIESVYPSQSNFEQVVAFKLIPEARDGFRDMTSANKKRNLCVIFNEHLVTRPVINSTLPGEGIIEGIGELEEIKNLVVTIKSGSLKIKPVLFMEQQIGPTLGEDAIRRGIMAIVVGFVLVCVFMLWIYRVGGMLAITALITNLVVLLGVMQMMGATLSLPGVAGIILTVGIAVDANILIFERIREEREKGKTFVQSVKNGYGRATVTILDANITTLITGVVLYMFGSGPVKGFAFVLIAGLLVNLFTAIYMTKTFVAWAIDKKKLSDLKVVRLFTPPKLDFLSMGKPALLASLAVIIAGMVLFIGTLDQIKGIDFSGGALIRVQLKKNVEIAAFRDKIQALLGTTDNKNIDIVSVEGKLGPAAGAGTNIFEIKQSMKDDSEADGFIKTVREGLRKEGLLVDNPIDAHDGYAGVDGKDPGRIVGVATPTTPEETNRTKYDSGFRFRLAFFDPVDKVDVENSLTAVLNGAESMVTPIGEATDGKHGSFEVWCKSGPYTAGIKTISDLGADLTARFRSQVPPMHLSDPVPVQRFIGSRVARDFVNKAILAIIVSIIALIAYIRIRFHDFTYGIAASAALVHDVLITMGAIALFDYLGIVNVKITLPIIAAFLTIIGYSLNDTIVIFDRLRENLSKAAMPLRDAMNQAITQSLTRTFFTSATTLFVVLCLFAFNWGERGVLEGLGFALSVGVISGTYSTIFVACPTVLFLSRWGAGAGAPAGGKGKDKQKPQTA